MARVSGPGHGVAMVVLPGSVALHPSVACSVGVEVGWTNHRERRELGLSIPPLKNLQCRDNASFTASSRPIRSRYLIPRPFTYSTKISDADPVQLSELWAITLKVNREPQKIMKSLQHTSAFVVVLAEDHDDPSSTNPGTKIVGVGRAISDGAFIATICDVAVHPSYQHRGIGRTIVKQLVQDMKRKGGASGFAAFPPPTARRFFWMIGFRAETKYCIMAYRGKLEIQDCQEETKSVTQGRCSGGEH